MAWSDAARRAAAEARKRHSKAGVKVYRGGPAALALGLVRTRMMQVKGAGKVIKTPGFPDLVVARSYRLMQKK